MKIVSIDKLPSSFVGWGSGLYALSGLSKYIVLKPGGLTWITPGGIRPINEFTTEQVAWLYYELKLIGLLEGEMKPESYQLVTDLEASFHRAICKILQRQSGEGVFSVRTASQYKTAAELLRVVFGAGFEKITVEVDKSLPVGTVLEVD